VRRRLSGRSFTPCAIVLIAVVLLPSNSCHRVPPGKPFEPMTNNGWPHNTPTWCGTQLIPESPDHPSRRGSKHSTRPGGHR
jgi:hypothetical protein